MSGESDTRVLIVEDEAHLADVLRFNLEAEGYRAEVVETGESALDRAPASDLVLLDVMLPGIDGFETVSLLRERGCFVPVMMLTARGRPEDILRGFDAGADDYLPKPFDLSILFARVGGLLRRAAWSRQRPLPESEPALVEQITLGDRIIDLQAMEIRQQDKTLHLTLMETNLMRYLVRHAGEVVSRRSLLEDVWGVREDTDTRAIDNFIVRLRRYIEEEPARPRYLLTVRGVGYRFVIVPEAGEAEAVTS